jgi:hypothetical protein
MLLAAMAAVYARGLHRCLSLDALLQLRAALRLVGFVALIPIIWQRISRDRAARQGGRS